MILSTVNPCHYEMGMGSAGMPKTWNVTLSSLLRELVVGATHKAEKRFECGLLEVRNRV